MIEKLVTRPWLDINRKVKAATGAGIGVTVLAFIINQYLPGFGDQLAPHICALITALATAGAGYLARERAQG